MINTPNFLEGLSEAALKYHEVSNKMIQHRIDNRMANWDNENPFLDELDDIWNNATEEEVSEMEKLPRMWWFQALTEDGNVTEKSELDVYPYAQYFVKQKPYLLGDDVSHMKGKPHFGDKTWKPNMAVFYLMVEDEDANGELVLEMKTMSNEIKHYEELQENYEFLRYCDKCPVFKKKN